MLTPTAASGEGWVSDRKDTEVRDDSDIQDIVITWDHWNKGSWPCGDKDIVPRQEQIEVEDMNTYRMSSPLSYPDLDHLFGQDNNIKTLLLYYIFSDFVWNLHKFRSGHFSQRWKFLITQPNAAS